ncbi:low-density lipoprotein receptor-related protein 11 isoform X1 [Electrophorus electricus]|nr:low-density lipoprotein receptor-related protein 11 isoform X1 [Electrophorus electricus]
MFFPALHQHRPLMCFILFCILRTCLSRSSQISDLKSKISGVEELLEEFRKQLQQDQTYSKEEELGADACLGDFEAVEERIIRAMASIEQGATFLSAPSRVYSWRDCLHACCAEPHCTVVVMQEDLKQADDSLRCYLFNCTYRGENVCEFSFQQGFSTYSRGVRNGTVSREHHRTTAVGSGVLNKQSSGVRRPLDEANGQGDSSMQELDEPPRSDAGLDVVVQLPTDWAILDGRDSIDDHGVTRYEWAIVKGDPSVSMKVTHPGLLKLGGLREGLYTFRMTVTDTIGQRSSDNVTVTVLAPAHHAEVCTRHCSRYQFMCDDGCCIDISYACDGKQQCPDRSDEDFCQHFDGGRKVVTHANNAPSQNAPAREADGRAMIPAEPHHGEISEEPSEQNQPAVSQDPCTAPPVVGPCKGAFPRWYYDPAAGECKHFLYGGCKGNHNNFLQQGDCVNECIQKPAPRVQQATAAPTPTRETVTDAKLPSSEAKHEEAVSDYRNAQPITKAHVVAGGQPPPESGAIVPLILGVIISALLLLMVACRMRVVHRRIKKAQPLTTEESDYLINGMYL